MPLRPLSYFMSPATYKSIFGYEYPQKWLDISHCRNILLLVFVAVLPVFAYAFLALSSRKYGLDLKRRLRCSKGVGPVQVYFTASRKYLDSIIVLIWRNDE